ncbi:hypothetical protein NBRC116601_11050 [Cognatishimia sp. WU-CL00825]|uniref:DUF7742 family protein n=1 Tax=Cognatishimia sp. WU-CL00825 TaxID=3127658 RepID=UPI00310BABF7
MTMARALMAVRTENPARLCQKWCAEAEAADKYRKKFQRAHPRWGNGSLMARACLQTPTALAGVSVDNPAYCQALAVVLTTLADWRRSKHRRSGRS